MLPGADDDHDGILADFTQRVLEDHESGGIADVSEYVARYPGYEDVIAREYDALVNGRVAIDPAEGSVSGADRIGDYRLLEEIGRGGQGVVYRALDTRVGRTVALKVMHAWSAASASVLQRFHREAVIASRLDDPGICTVYETGVDRGVPYMAMKLIDGETLARVIGRSGEIVAEEVRDRVALVERIARSLHAAHELGVVHRDIKPANVMLTASGDPVILDFGLAHDESGSLASLTRTGDLNGTLPYMAPEQLDEGVRDRRADVYSLGVILFECVTGRRPFIAATRAGLLEMIHRDEPPRVRDLNPAASRDLEVVVETALAKDCDRRYASADALADELRRVFEGLPILARRVSPVGRLLRWARRRPAVAALVAIVIIGLPIVAAMAGFIAANLESIEKQKHREQVATVETKLAAAYGEITAGRHREALAHFDEAIALLPDHAPSLSGKAVSLILDDRPEEARPLVSEIDGTVGDTIRLMLDGNLDAFLELDSYGPEEHYLAAFVELSRIQGRGGRAERALRHARAAVLMAPQPRARYHFAFADALMYDEAPAGAPALASSIVRNWPDDANAWFWAGAVVHRHDPERAVGDLEQALRLEPDHLAALDMLAWCQMTIGDADGAVATLRRAVELNPIVVLCVRFAVALENAGEITEALEVIEATVLAEPDHFGALLTQASILERLGRDEESIAALQKCVEHHPESEAAHRTLGGLLGRAGRVQSALAHLQRAVELAPSPNGYGLLGQALRSLARHEEALAAFEAGLALDGGEENCLRGLAPLYVKLGRYREAEAAARRAFERVGPDQENLFAFSRALAGRGRFGEALTAFRRARSSIERSTAGLDGELAALFVASGQVEEGLARLEDLVDEHPTDVENHIRLARAFMADGDHGEALRVAEGAVRMAADDPSAHMELGRALAGLERFEEAVASFRKAVSLDSGLAEAHCHLGRVLLRLDRAADAVEALRRGHRLGSTREHWPLDSAAWLRAAEDAVRDS